MKVKFQLRIQLNSDRYSPEWKVIVPSSSIDRLVIRANMERSRRRDLRAKKAKIMINIKPTMATGTAHTTGPRPFFLPPVCFPGDGAGAGAGVGWAGMFDGLTLPSKEIMRKMECSQVQCC